MVFDVCGVVEVKNIVVIVDTSGGSGAVMILVATILRFFLVGGGGCGNGEVVEYGNGGVGSWDKVVLVMVLVTNGDENGGSDDGDEVVWCSIGANGGLGLVV